MGVATVGGSSEGEVEGEMATTTMGGKGMLARDAGMVPVSRLPGTVAAVTDKDSCCACCAFWVSWASCASNVFDVVVATFVAGGGTTATAGGAGVCSGCCIGLGTVAVKNSRKMIRRSLPLEIITFRLLSILLSPLVILSPLFILSPPLFIFSSPHLFLSSPLPPRLPLSVEWGCNPGAPTLIVSACRLVTAPECPPKRNKHCDDAASSTTMTPVIVPITTNWILLSIAFLSIVFLSFTLLSFTVVSFAFSPVDICPSYL